jgi:hypothetical protein
LVLILIDVELWVVKAGRVEGQLCEGAAVCERSIILDKHLLMDQFVIALQLKQLYFALLETVEYL